MNHIIKIADKTISIIETYLLVVSMTAFAFGVVLDVILRKFFGFNLHFLQELGKYLMVWATFIGASVGVKTRSHPNMSVIIDSVPDPIKIVISILVNLICAGGLGFAGYWSWQQFLLNKRMGTMTSTLGRIPVYVLYIVVPAGLFVMVVRFLIQAYKNPREILEKMKNKGGNA